MSSIEEKRIYTENAGETTVYLASELGVVRVSVSADRIGDFGIEQRCSVRDLTWVGDLIVATNEDVLVGGNATEFGPAVAVCGDAEPIAVGEEGRVARFDEDGWDEIGRLEDVRAADGDLLATGEGVFRVGDRLTHVGLDEVNDISVAGTPLAATASGLYRLGNGWMRDLEGAFDRVAGIGSAGELQRACTLGDRFFVHEAGWQERETPERFVAVGVGEAFYGATTDGTLAVDAGDGWRSQALGVSGVRTMVVQ